MQLNNVDLFHFWADREWPNGSGDFIFLGEAIDQAGAFLFPNEWTGIEFATLPDRSKNEVAIMLTAEALGQIADTKHHDILTARRNISAPELSLEEFMRLEQDETKEAAQEARKEWYDSLASLERAKAVARLFRREAAEGRLEFAARPEEGGVLTPIPDWMWNSERVFQRFIFCRIDLTEPFENYVDGPDHQFVYVRKSQLDELTTFDGEKGPEGQAMSSVESASTVSLPVKNLGLKKKRASSSDNIAKAVAALWPGGDIPPSPADRRKLIGEFLKPLKLTVPSDRTFRRYFNED